ncbi:MAG: amino acid permease, partial [Staphylococcus warneri]|nr:amino acid permease [Staphylococcus warneri]
TFGIIGSVVSFIFLCLLLIPGTKASLSLPSYIALGVWLVLGLIFFAIRYPKLKKMDNDELSRLILNRSEDEVESMVEEPANQKS